MENTNVLPSQISTLKLAKFPKSNLNAVEKKVMQLTSQMEKKIEAEIKNYGSCYKCQKSINDIKYGCQALGRIYHTRCFTCCLCNRSLKNKPFYMVKGSIYCQEDYMYSGFQQATEKCASCGHLIMDKILQTFGKSFHPECFRCKACNVSLDGVPFALSQDDIYCYMDYNKKFAIKCHKCQNDIHPTQKTGEIVRIKAFQKDFHIDCFKCDVCHAQLNNDGNHCCAQLLPNRFLVCHSCNKQKQI